MKPRRSAAVCGNAQDELLLPTEGVKRADMFVMRLWPEIMDTGVVDLITKSFHVHLSESGET